MKHRKRKSPCLAATKAKGKRDNQQESGYQTNLYNFSTLPGKLQVYIVGTSTRHPDGRRFNTVTSEGGTQAYFEEVS